VTSETRAWARADVGDDATQASIDALVVGASRASTWLASRPWRWNMLRAVHPSTLLNVAAADERIVFDKVQSRRG